MILSKISKKCTFSASLFTYTNVMFVVLISGHSQTMWTRFGYSQILGVFLPPSPLKVNQFLLLKREIFCKMFNPTLLPRFHVPLWIQKYNISTANGETKVGRYLINIYLYCWLKRADDQSPYILHGWKYKLYSNNRKG